MNAAVILIATVPKLLVRESLLLLEDFPSFKRQETTLTGLNLFLLATLLLTDVLFSPYLGRTPATHYVVLLAGIITNTAELIWINRKQTLNSGTMVGLTAGMIVLNTTVAFALAVLSYRKDVQYFALMIVPIFQAAFRLSLGATISTVIASDSLIFFWVWNYFQSHDGEELNEYLEAGTIAVIFAAGGLLVWTLVNHLRSKQQELEAAKAKLLVEERLAVLGRFSSAIAHEIRNPVAMISSALQTAAHHPPDSTESQEMFEIAASEATRLEALTTDFLTYARPRAPAKQRLDVADSIAYIGDICRPRAAQAEVEVRSESPEGLWAQVDSGQLQQALLNLAMNAIEASAPGGTVVLRGKRAADRIVVEVENTSGPIATDAVRCIFEPFFTTKAKGTGLGLAIARSFALAHSGDLILSRNQPELVQFSIVIPAEASTEVDRP